jgi:rhomboid protease GluP
MRISWGYSPKIKKNIPLGDLPIDRYLIIAQQAIANLGWSLSRISARGIIAYTPISLQSYSEEIAIKIENNSIVFTSECVGIQMLFNDYGKNAQNLERFVNEFGYAKAQLEGSLDELKDINFVEELDFFEKTPLSAKHKIKNVFYLLIPQEKYVATPMLIFLNVAYFATYLVFTGLFYQYLVSANYLIAERLGYYLGANSREYVLDGQYWRLVTHQFAHWSFFHLFFNLYALAYIGLMVEHVLGFKKYVITYLISGICGGLLSLTYHESGYMTGASGAIMGLFGAFLALLVSNAFEKNATRALLISTIALLGLMLISGALNDNVDNAAHIGGLVSGFIICYVIFNDKLWKWSFSPTVRYFIVGCFALFFAVGVVHLTPQMQTKEFLALEKRYKQNWQTYNTIFKLPPAMATGKKLQIVQERGIDLWKENEALVQQMLALKLSKEQRYKAEFHAKVARIESRMAVLLYKECAESTKYYRREIRELTRELNNLRMETVED